MSRLYHSAALDRNEKKYRIWAVENGEKKNCAKSIE
jgi:hypothetical protein